MLNKHKQAGFNLIDLMIGMAIGLISLAAVTKIYIDFNNQKNISVATTAAQGNGAIALYMLEHDISQAGFGISGFSACDFDASSETINYYHNALASKLSTMPVRITEGVGTASDNITIQYATSISGVPSTSLTTAQANFGDMFNVVNTAGFDVDSLIMTGTGSDCTISEISAVNAAQNKIEHTGGDYNSAALPAGATNGWIAAVADEKVLNIGRLISNTYSIDGNNLMLEPFGGADSDAANGIVFMKAQYGRDITNDNVNAVDEWSYTAPTDNTQVIAIRIGLVSRSARQEATASVMADDIQVLDETNGSGNGIVYNIPDKHYHYKLYRTTVPLRNVIWAK